MFRLADARWNRLLPAASLSRTMAALRPPEAEDTVREVKEDLFSCPATSSLAHCISQDCRMGKGIAVLFKNKFGGVQELIKQGKKSGQTAVLNRGGRYIYYMVTKEKFWHKPTYASVKLSLEAVRDHCAENDVAELCMPRIGSGLDGLQWPKVKKIIEDVFSDGFTKVTVYYV